MKAAIKSIRWLTEPEVHDYEAAASYLALLYAPLKVAEMVKGLKAASMAEFCAKDISRASQLAMLPATNFHVQKDLTKLAKGKQLSPILLFRDEPHNKLIIADGYHRLCTVYGINENAMIPCKLC